MFSRDFGSLKYLKHQIPSQLLHPLINQSLSFNGISRFTDIQNAALPDLVAGKHVIIQGEASSGKTLAYLLPILQKMYSSNELEDKRFVMNSANEDQMFQNADEIFNRKNQSLFDQMNKMKGALILTYSKELVGQIYSQGRLLDQTQKIRFNRVSSSLQMKTSIVEHLTPDKNPETKNYEKEELFNISMSNVANNASWRFTDVLLSTPMTLHHILKMKHTHQSHDINPAIVVIDEADLLLESQGTDRHILEILKKFMSKRGPLASDNSKRQFIFTTSTLSDSTLRLIENWLPDVKVIRSPKSHRIPDHIEVKDIPIDGNDLEKLFEVLTDQPTIVFCDSQRKVDKVCDFLREKNVINLPYVENDKITTQMRHATLSLFYKGRLPVLVCTNLAARGLDTLNAKHVIQFDYAKNAIDYMQRLGRCGRLGQNGQFTSFIRKGDRELANKITNSKGNLDLLITQTNIKNDVFDL